MTPRYWVCADEFLYVFCSWLKYVLLSRAWYLPCFFIDDGVDCCAVFDGVAQTE